MNTKSKLGEYFNQHIEALTMFSKNNGLDVIVDLIIDRLRMGGTLYAFGNGGSAADASHFVGELVGCFENRNRLPYRAICLNTDIAVMTSIANDYSYSDVFSRQIEGHIKSSDIVIGFSTSGNSLNVINAIRVANIYGALTIGFTGSSTHNSLKETATYNVVVPSERTCIIQEIHQLAIHYIAGQVEGELK